MIFRNPAISLLGTDQLPICESLRVHLQVCPRTGWCSGGELETFVVHVCWATKRQEAVHVHSTEQQAEGMNSVHTGQQHDAGWQTWEQATKHHHLPNCQQVDVSLHFYTRCANRNNICDWSGAQGSEEMKEGVRNEKALVVIYQDGRSRIHSLVCA